MNESKKKAANRNRSIASYSMSITDQTLSLQLNNAEMECILYSFTSHIIIIYEINVTYLRMPLFYLVKL